MGGVQPRTRVPVPLRADVLIRVDWIAGAVVGALVLSLHGWLAALYALPAGIILFMGCANIVYASLSFTLAARTRGGVVPYLRVVAAANMVWAVVCLSLAIIWFGEASALGVAQLIGEALFVGGLGVLEWRAAAASPAAQPPAA
jgi:hypothetical protein